MTIATEPRPDVGEDLVARIPPIVDLDAHLVEPEDVWTSRLPASTGISAPCRVPARGDAHP